MKNYFLCIYFLITWNEAFSQHQFQKNYGNLYSITDVFGIKHSPRRTTILFRPGDCLDINHNYNCLNIGFLSFDSLDNPINSVVLHSPNYDTSYYVTDFLNSPNGEIISAGVAFTQNGTLNKICIFLTDSSFSFLHGNYLNLNRVFYSHIKRKGTIGPYYVSGTIDSANILSRTILLSKIDTTLIPVWSKVYSTQNISSIEDLELMQNGNITICGYVRDTGSSFQKILIMSLDSSGNVLWSKNYSTQKHASASVIKPLLDGIIICGTAYDSVYDRHCPYLMKLDTSGNIIWFKKYVCGAAGLIGMYPSYDGGFLISSQFAFGGGVACLIKTDSLGNVQWNYFYPNGYWNLQHCEADDHGFYSLAKTSYAGGFPLPDSLYMFLIKTDSLGSTGCYETTFPITISTDNNFTVNSQTVIVASYTPTVDSFLLVKDTLPLYEITFCDTYTEINNIKLDILNYNIYPNPTSDKLFLNLESTTSTAANVYVTDMFGKRINQIREIIQSGNNILNFDVTNFTNGFYILTIETKQGTKRSKFIKSGE